eukprot:scaffold13629_cov101-Isochrysis_galbana.AAC.9
MNDTQPNKARERHGRGVWLGPTGRHLRGQPLTTPRIRAPAPPTTPTWLSATVDRRHAPARIINRAPMPSPGSHRHPDVRAGAWGVAAAFTRRHPAHHASNTPPRLQQR